MANLSRYQRTSSLQEESQSKMAAPDRKSEVDSVTTGEVMEVGGGGCGGGDASAPAIEALYARAEPQPAMTLLPVTSCYSSSPFPSFNIFYIFFFLRIL
jgi:hypothetical protein